MLHVSPVQPEKFFQFIVICNREFHFSACFNPREGGKGIFTRFILLVKFSKFMPLPPDENPRFPSEVIN